MILHVNFTYCNNNNKMRKECMPTAKLLDYTL